MTDAEFETQRGRVQALFDAWSARLALSHWDFYFDWHRENPKDHQDGVIMTVNPEWEYLHANVQVYLAEVRERDEQALIGDVVHELCHCLVAPMSTRKVDPKLEEFTVSTLSRVIRVLAGEYR